MKLSLQAEDASPQNSFASLNLANPFSDNIGELIVTGSTYLDNPGRAIPANSVALLSYGNNLTLGGAMDIRFFAGSFAAANERMRINGFGNIGIAKTNPSEKLDVNGNVKATAFIGDGSQLTGITAGATGDSFWRLTSPGETGIINTNTGYVGIGVAAPQEQLHVGGTIKGTGFKLPTGAFPGAVLMCADAEGTMYWGTGPAVIDGGVEPSGAIDGGGVTGGGLPLIDGGVEVSGGGVTGSTGPEIDGGGVTGGGSIEGLDGGSISEPDLDGGGVV